MCYVQGKLKKFTNQVNIITSQVNVTTGIIYLSQATYFICKLDLNPPQKSLEKGVWLIAKS